MSTSSSSHHPSRVLPRQLITSKRCLRPARQSLCKPAAKHSGKPRFKHGGPAVCRVPPTANSRTCHHEPSTRPSPACARSSVLNRKQPPIQLKSTVLGLKSFSPAHGNELHHLFLRLSNTGVLFHGREKTKHIQQFMVNWPFCTAMWSLGLMGAGCVLTIETKLFCIDRLDAL